MLLLVAYAIPKTPEGWTALVTLTVLVLGMFGGAIRWLYTTQRDREKQEADQVTTAAANAEANRDRDRALLLQQLERTTKELTEVAPTIASIRKEYVEVAQREMALMDELRNTRAEAVVQRRRLMAMIGGLSLQLSDLRRYFTDTTGLALPPVQDPLGILAEAEAEARAQGMNPPTLPIPPKKEA